MFIEQISVFLENNPGTLREMTQLLGEGGVDLLALSIADTQSFGIVRMIVHSGQIEGAMKMLKDGGYVARVNHVICATVPDKPLGLSSLLGVIERAGLSVEYMYSFLRGSAQGTARMILRLNDGAKAEQVFTEQGITMLSQQQVDSL